MCTGYPGCAAYVVGGPELFLLRLLQKVNGAQCQQLSLAVLLAWLEPSCHDQRSAATYSYFPVPGVAEEERACTRGPSHVCRVPTAIAAIAPLKDIENLQSIFSLESLRALGRWFRRWFRGGRGVVPGPGPRQRIWDPIGGCDSTCSTSHEFSNVLVPQDGVFVYHVSALMFATRCSAGGISDFTTARI